MEDRAGIDLRLEGGGGRTGRTVRVHGHTVLLGRGPGCNLRLASDIISREHARLEVRGDAWHVRDLGSSNGTLLNGADVQTAALRPGDVIRLGEAGPRLRVLDVRIPGADFDEDATRMLRVPDLEPILTLQPVTEDSIPTIPPVAGVEASRPRRFGFPLGALLGLAFGLVTAWGVWPGIWFPYFGVTLPAQVIVDGLSSAAPSTMIDLAPWPLTILVVLHYGMLGYSLQRPKRRWILAVALVVVHGLATASLFLT